jgi:hypothetical protein
MQQVLVCHTDRSSWIYDALIRHLSILQDNSCMKWRYVEWKEGRKDLASCGGICVTTSQVMMFNVRREAYVAGVVWPDVSREPANVG